MNICVFGASITWGAYDPEGGGFANRLRSYFEEKTEDEIEVYNLGISGDTTTDLLQRIEVEAKAREPKVLLFDIGTNDSQFINSKNNNKVPFEEFEKNLEKIVVISKTFTDKLIFIGLTPVDEKKTTPIPWGKDKSYTMENVTKYNNALQNFCEKNNFKFISLINEIDIKELYDGLHPNSEGHKKMYEKIKLVLEQVIEEE